jgi:DnaJ-class molecular chaperone
MDHVRGNAFGRIPEAMKWCPHCNGYGSSPKEASGGCTHCGGSGLVWTDREPPVAGGNGEPSERS